MATSNNTVEPSRTAKGKWFKENLKNLNEGDCRFTSKSTFDYNCLGFVVGDYRWWHYSPQVEHYWPDGIARNFYIDTVVAALATEKFEVCPTQTPDPEPGFEKIVLFSYDKEFKHVAAITDAKLWKSKLGDYEDIEHPPSLPRMGKYGFCAMYLRRDVKFAGDPLPDEYKI